MQPGIPRRNKLPGWIAIFAIALALACGSKSPMQPAGNGHVVASIDVSPSDVTLTYLGERQQVMATARDDEGHVVTEANLKWSSGTPEVATVTSTGQLEAISNGASRIRVSVGQVEATVQVAVAQVATVIVLSPNDGDLIGDGDTLTLTATARDRGGHRIQASAFMWASDAPGVAAVDGNGHVRATGHGTATVTATAADGASGSVHIEAFPSTGEGVGTLDQALVDFMQRWNVPGLSIAVVENGRLVVARGLGLGDTEADEPMHPDDRARMASVSKPITSTAILKLVERGDLNLTDRVFPDLLPGFWAEAQPPVDARLADITVRELLQHQGGWDRSRSGDPMFMPRSVAAELGTPSPPEAADIVRYVLGRPLDFTPGAAVSYSNFGFSLLARVVEAVTGTDYETWVRNEILIPAGAAGLRIGGTLVEDRQSMEVHYSGLGSEAGQVSSVFDDFPGQVPLPYGGFYLAPMDGNGGWVGSAVDLVRFAAAVDGRDGDDLITAGSRDLVVESLVELSGGRYGLGWFVDSDGTWHHTGRLPGSASRLVIRGDGLEYAVLLNASHPDEDAFLGDLVATLATAVAAVAEWPDRDLFEAFE